MLCFWRLKVLSHDMRFEKSGLAMICVALPVDTPKLCNNFWEYNFKFTCFNYSPMNITAPIVQRETSVLPAYKRVHSFDVLDYLNSLVPSSALDYGISFNYYISNGR